MNDDTVSPVFIKPWVTPKKIYGTKVNQVWIDEAMNVGDLAMQSLTDEINQQTAQRIKDAALDELFGEE